MALSRGIMVIATPYGSGFDYFYIADEVQLKADRCLRFFQDTVSFDLSSMELFFFSKACGPVVTSELNK